MVQIMSDDINHTLGKLEGQLSYMDSTFKSLQKDIQDVLRVTHNHGPRIDELERKVAKLEESRAWVVGRIIGWVLAAVVGAVLIKTGIPLPK